jgi:phosphoribosylformylglycinamidine synthase
MGENMKAIVNVYLKKGVLDPQGKAVHHALGSLGFDGIKDVRIGKQIVLELETEDEEKAQEEVQKMSETLLANTVIEDFHIEIVQ